MPALSSARPQALPTPCGRSGQVGDPGIGRTIGVLAFWVVLCVNRTDDSAFRINGDAEAIPLMGKVTR